MTIVNKAAICRIKTIQATTVCANPENSLSILIDYTDPVTTETGGIVRIVSEMGKIVRIWFVAT